MVVFIRVPVLIWVNGPHSVVRIKFSGNDRICSNPGVRDSRIHFIESSLMILELADIRIHPGQNAAFEEAIQRGVATVASTAKGFQGYKVNRGIESPERYILQIFWDTLEDHTVGFRQGPLFVQWRAIVGPFFAVPPTVEHFDLVVKSES